MDGPQPHANVHKGRGPSHVDVCGQGAEGEEGKNLIFLWKS